MHALSVIVLPNDSDTQLAAEAAARAAADEGVEVHVVPLAGRGAGRGRAGGLRPRATTRPPTCGRCTARRRRPGTARCPWPAGEALTDAGRCRPGDVLGLVDGQIVLVGSDLARVGGEVLERLLGSGGELLTVVTGERRPRGPRAAPSPRRPAPAAATSRCR